MLSRRRVGVVVGGVATVAAIGVGYPAGAGLSPDGVDVLRAVLAVGALALVVVAGVYAASGYAEQATGHALAGVGLAVAAAFGHGVGVWVGVVVAIVGGVLLVRDAVYRGRGRPPSA
ncbi:hypothetical protein [Halorubrum sp. DTA98]|uniref:hypothetical protein n=1 Tax=Halorubrum sp. DTA98 TaxID=3402163 RepID=UPI003AAFA3C2